MNLRWYVKLDAGTPRERDCGHFHRHPNTAQACAKKQHYLIFELWTIEADALQLSGHYHEPVQYCGCPQHEDYHPIQDDCLPFGGHRP